MGRGLFPYLTFNGNCKEAVEFYEKVLGGKAQIMRFGDAPPDPNFPVSENMKNLVLHAELVGDGHRLYFSDSMPDAPSRAGNNTSFVLEFDTKDEVKPLFEALSQGGKVDMEPQETFFSPLYARCTDKFGVMWQLLARQIQA